LGGGPMRMNRVVVAQAAAGLAAFLLRSPDEEAPTAAPPDRLRSSPLVVVGYDGRESSDVFARDAAEVLAGAGIRVSLLPRALPTPVLAFCVRHLDAAAGVMITASHNPPRDNGMKVYLGGADGGSQIVPPADAEIAAAIARVAKGSVADLPRSGGIEVLGEGVVDAYVEAAARAAGPEAAGAGGIRVAYTAMHGVGLATLRRAFAAAGLREPLVVPEQAEPDAAFPTLVFPNPEEPGALDLATAFATAHAADLVVANDPDADRLAVAVPDATAPGGWRRLTGNDVGLLLGWEAAAAAATRGDEEPRAMLASSLVSSPGLAAIAEHHGLGHVETLTGFKWISRVPGLVFGYEEALGYLVNPDRVRDKDGISAAVRFVALAGRWRAAGYSVDEALDALAERIGGTASGQVSIRVDDLDEIVRLTDRLRAEPPAAIAGRAVVRAVDRLADAEHAADLLRYDLEDGSRVIVRPSGTEPKLKAYLDARSEEGTGRERRAAAAAIVVELERSVRELLGC
ncbi:MAG: phosphomannomutase, partial [Micrococcales bacterium 73-13]